MADEAYVQIVPDGSGKAIRNVTVPVVGTDGVQRTEYQQVTTPADRAGNSITPTETERLLHLCLDELRGIREILAHAHGQFFHDRPGKDTL